VELAGSIRSEALNVISERSAVCLGTVAMIEATGRATLVSKLSKRNNWLETARQLDINCCYYRTSLRIHDQAISLSHLRHFGFHLAPEISYYIHNGLDHLRAVELFQSLRASHLRYSTNSELPVAQAPNIHCGLR
jgi:hypothetical protein